MPRRREEDFLRNDEFSLYDLCGHSPAQNPCPGVMKVTIMVDSTLVINTIHLVSMDHTLH